MSKRRIHLQMMQMGAWMPKSRCGLWYAITTRNKSMVTCESCKRYFPLAEAIPMQQGRQKTSTWNWAYSADKQEQSNGTR